MFDLHYQIMFILVMMISIDNTLGQWRLPDNYFLVTDRGIPDFPPPTEASMDMQQPTGSDDVYKSNSGLIRYPAIGGSYRNNENCYWTIIAEHPLNITFASFDTEECCDNLTIYDGENSRSSLLGTLSGSSVSSSSFQTSTSSAYLLFTSDSGGSGNGFELRWEPLDVIPHGGGCNYNQVACGNALSCIDNSLVCDGEQNCADGSDEVPLLCEEWEFSSRCPKGQVYTNTIDQCTDFGDYCINDQYESSTVIGKTCKIVLSQQLPRVKYSVKRSVLTSEHVKLLSEAVNSTLNHQNCPMLYTKLGNHCIAFYSMAQVPWPEARQFCQSIYGDLISFDDIQMYQNIHEYIKEMQLTTDYWLGGRYSMDNNGWTWLDDSPMPQGSPYWAERYSSSCVARALPSKDPFSGQAEPLPGAPCYNYLQAPKERSLGYCAAITYQHFYYVTDEECTSPRSPLCILNTEHRTNIFQQNVDA